MKLINSHCLTATNTVRSVATITVLVLSLSATHGENLTTLDGKIYINIADISKYPKQVFFNCDSNRIGIAITNLPEDFRAKYGITIPTNSVTATAQQENSQLSSDDLFLTQHINSELEVETNVLFDVTNQFFPHHSCYVKVNPKGFRFSTFGGEYMSICDFKFGEETIVKQIFENFFEWQAIAVKNEAVPFSREIRNITTQRQGWMLSNLDRTFTFMWNGSATLSVYSSDPEMSANGILEAGDVLACEDFLKTIPTLKSQLVQKIQNQETQKKLFK